MIRRCVNPLEALKTRSQAPWRELCRELPYSSVMRWRYRLHLNLPVWQSPGPKKTEPLDWKEFHCLLDPLEHGRQRTQGTGVLYCMNGPPHPSPAGNWAFWFRIRARINSTP
jgi:hypothetical protein